VRRVHLLAAALALAAGVAVQAQDSGRTVRPEIGKPIQAALELLKGKRAREALARAREAQAAGPGTVYETMVVNQVIGQAAAAAGDPAAAARAFEAAAASSAATAEERHRFTAAAAGQHYLNRDYGKAAELAGRYLRDGGTDRSMRTLHAQALYLSGSFAAAARTISAAIEADEQAGRVPQEEHLNLLASATHQQRDAAGHARAVEKLAIHHPKPEHWTVLLHEIANRPGFSPRLAIHVARLKLATGSLRAADEYLEAAQLALQEGFPAEASRIIERGYAAGLLGKGDAAARHQRLKDMAARSMAEARAAAARDPISGAAPREGRAVFDEGYYEVLQGRADQGLAAMERGLKLGTGFRNPEHARLQLAYAYHLAGRGPAAVQAFRGVRGTDGAAAVARLWLIHLGRSGPG
jgi:hypothetical protein